MTLLFSAASPLAKPLQPVFGHVLGLDIGASNRQKGTIKGRVFEDNGKEVFEHRGIISEQGFKNAQSLVDGLQNFAKKMLNTLNLTDGDVTHIIGVIPGPVNNAKQRVPIMVNLETTDGKPLENIEFKSLLNTFPNSRLTLTNDTLGGGAYIAHQLVTHPQYKNLFKEPGTYAYILATGGGLAVADIIYPHKDVGILLKATEGGHHPFQTGNLETEGLSAPALVKKFAQALKINGMPEADLAAIKGSTRVEIITSFAEAQKALPNLTKADYEKAAVYAVNAYLNAMTFIAQCRVAHNAKLGVIYGRLDRGIGDFVAQHPHLFQNDLDHYNTTPDIQRNDKNTLEKILLARTYYGGLAKSDTVIKKLMVKNQFDITTKIHLEDNAHGGWYLAQGNYTSDDSPWFQIPLDKLRQSTH